MGLEGLLGASTGWFDGLVPAGFDVLASAVVGWVGAGGFKAGGLDTCRFAEGGFGAGGLGFGAGGLRFGAGGLDAGSPESGRIGADGGAYFAGPQVTFGSVPATKAIITGRTQPPPAFKSTGTTTILSGTGKSMAAVPASASDMNAVQMGTATREPVSSRPRLRGRSYPTQTPVASFGV